jgi:hypothetical protein
MRAKAEIYQVGHGRVPEQQRRGLLDILKSRFGERKNRRTRQKGGSFFAHMSPRVLHMPPTSRENPCDPVPRPGTQAQPLSHSHANTKDPAASADAGIQQQSSGVARAQGKTESATCTVGHGPRERHGEVRQCRLSPAHSCHSGTLSLRWRCTSPEQV